MHGFLPPVTTLCIAALAALPRPIARRHSLLIAMLALCGAVAPASAQGQSAADLFNPETVHEIRLSINSRDDRELRERYQENTYYTADLTWQGVRVRNIGIRNRGLGSRNPTKPGFRVDFNRYTSGQTFLGLRSLILDNNWQDPSFLAERAAMAFFARLGEPAPRESVLSPLHQQRLSGPLLNRRIGRHAIPRTYLRQRSGVSIRVPISARVARRLSRRRAGRVQAILSA